MSLRTIIRPFSDAAAIEGTATDPAGAAHERQVRQARLELARRETSWTEITPAERLVRRGPFLVDSETDLLYVHRRGLVFEPGRATVGYVTPNTTLTFYVDRDDNVVFIDQPGGARTWSEIVARKATRR